MTTDPSFSLALASTAIRTNVCPNPGLGVDATGWGTNIGTVTRVAQGSGWAAQVQPSLTVGGYLYSPASAAAAAGSFWAGSVTLTGPAGRQVNVQLHDGTRYLTGTFVVTLGAGALVVLLRSTTAVVAGDTGLIRCYCYPQGTWAAGELLTATAATIEQVPAAGALCPNPFDGESLNAVWLGTRYASTSQTIGLSQRPNFPTLEVEAWPGTSPALTGVPATGGRFLTDRARTFKISRGRQYELAQDQAASGSLGLNNFDGAVTGGTNGCTPITSCRVRATWNGVTYPVWTGLIRSWPQQDDSPSVAWSEAELTDSFEPLANHPFGSFIAEEIRSQTSPDAWYPMNEASSSSSIGNLVPGGVSAPLVSFKLGAAPLQLGGTSVFPGTSETVLTLANATGATNHASQYQMVGPQNPGSGYSMPFGAPWAVGIFVRMTAGASVVWSALDTNGELMAAVLVDAGTNQIVAYTRAGGPGGTLNYAGVATTGMKGGCYVHAGHDGTNIFCYVYGVASDGTSLVYASGTGAFANCTGTSKWVAWGQSFRSDAIYSSSNADMQLAHGTIWTTSPPAQVGTGIVAIARAGCSAYAGRTPQVQVATLAALAGVASVAGDPADGQPLGQVRDTNGSSALDTIRSATLDYLGRVFMTKDAQLEWQSVHHGMGAPTQWTLGGQPGELPYSGAPAFDFDPTYVYNDVQVTRPDTRGVSQQNSSTKAVARVTDTASIASYFQRVLQVDSNVMADADALAVAQYLLARYKQPRTRVRTVKFNPAANPALWPFVLGAELGDTVTLNHRALGRPTVTLTLAVQQISHEVDAASGQWITTMELAPWSSDWVLAAMHTTVAATVASGVSSITLNPLPDSATNSAEQSLGVGTTITLSPGTANAETVTIASVTSTPTAGAAGYTGITLGLKAPTGKAHTAGDVACDPLPAGVTDPTTWDAFSVLDSTTVVSI